MSIKKKLTFDDSELNLKNKGKEPEKPIDITESFSENQSVCCAEYLEIDSVVLETEIEVLNSHVEDQFESQEWEYKTR